MVSVGSGILGSPKHEGGTFPRFSDHLMHDAR